MAKLNWYIVIATLFSCLGALLCGNLLGALNGVLEMDGFKETFSQLYGVPNGSLNYTSNKTQSCSAGNGIVADTWIGIITTSINVGAVFGALGSGWISNRFSRKYGLIISGFVGAVGSGILAASFYLWMLVIGRLLCGISYGMIYVMMPVYIAELSPKESRGMLASVIGPTFIFGIVIALGINAGMAEFRLGWRIVFVTGALLGVLYVIGMKFMPHSPRWLVMKGRDHEALLVLSRMNKQSSKETFVETCLELEELRSSITVKPWRSLIKELLQWKYTLLLMMFMFFLEPYMGILLLFYSATLFCEVGVEPFYSSLVFSLVFLLASVVLLLFIDRMGRKKLFLLSTAEMLVLMLTMSVLIHLFQPLSGILAYIVVVLVCLYGFGHACSWLTLPWIICSEIFPTNIKGITVTLATATYYFSSTFAIQLVPIIIGSPLQLHGLFYILTGLLVVGFFLVLFSFPETKGVSLEQMDVLFSQSVWQRIKGTCKTTQGQIEFNEQELEEKVEKL